MVNESKAREQYTKLCEDAGELLSRPQARQAAGKKEYLQLIRYIDVVGQEAWDGFTDRAIDSIEF